MVLPLTDQPSTAEPTPIGDAAAQATRVDPDVVNHFLAHELERWTADVHRILGNRVEDTPTPQEQPA